MSSEPPADAFGRAARMYRIVGAVVHDLSNPLQALVMNAELAVDGEADDDTSERRDADLSATRRMQAILRALTSLCAAAGQPRPLGDAVTRFEALLGRRWTRLGVKIRADISERRNLLVPSQLEEMLLLTGVEMSDWLRARPPHALTVAIDAREADRYTDVSVSVDDPDWARDLFAGIADRLSSQRELAPACEAAVHADRVSLSCERHGES